MAGNDPFFSHVDYCWLKIGAIVPVRDQKSCSACYAFAVADCISAIYYKCHRELVILSAQEFVDCLHIRYPPREDKKPEQDKMGCYAGSLRKAFKSAKDYGCYLEDDYGYLGYRRPECMRPKNAKYKIWIKRFSSIGDSLTDEEVHYHLKRHPICGAVNMVSSFENFVGSEIYMGPTEKEFEEIDKLKLKGISRFHAILIIGCLEEKGVEGFLIKNSWGPKWGRDGYAKIRRDIVSRMSYPVGAFQKDL